jgi:hypothetical protein
MSKTNYESNDALTWLQVHNFLPIITGVIAIVAAFNLLQNRVELQNQKIDYLAGKADQCLIRQGDLESKLNNQALDIKELQTGRTVSVKGVSTYRAPTPTPKK